MEASCPFVIGCVAAWSRPIAWKAVLFLGFYCVMVMDLKERVCIDLHCVNSATGKLKVDPILDIRQSLAKTVYKHF